MDFLYLDILLGFCPNYVQIINNPDRINWKIKSIKFSDMEERRDILQEIKSPTLVIHGDSDPLALPRDGYAIAHAITKAYLVMVPNMGHMIFNKELELQLIRFLIV